jgi:hypothetical protein
MSQELGAVTKVTQGRDATQVEVTMAGRKPLVWTVPNIMFARLGYTVGSAVRLNIDACGNLRGVSPA